MYKKWKIPGCIVAATAAVLAALAHSSEAAPDVCPPDRILVSVFDLETLEPVPAAVVELQPSDPTSSESPLGALKVKTGEDGCVCIPAAGGMSLKVSHPEYQAVALTAGAKPRDSTSRTEVGLVPVANLAMEVRDDTRSVPGARLFWRTGSGAHGEAEMDSNGRWRGIVGTSGEALSLAATAPGFATSCQAIARLHRGDNPARFVMQRPAEIRLAVLGSSDEPLTSVNLHWNPENGGQACADDLVPTGWPRIRSVPGAKEGTWTLRSLSSGRGLLRVDAPGHRTTTVGPFAVPPSSSIDIGSVTLEPSRSVAGFVRARSGKGLPDVQVTAFVHAGGRARRAKVLGKARTDSAGRFDIEIERDEDVDLRAGDPPGPIGEIEAVAPGEHAVEIRLPEPAAIFGVVLTSGDLPVNSAEVIASPLNPGEGRHSASDRRTTTNDRGRYELGYLGGGPWRIKVRANGFAPTVQAPVHLESGIRSELRFTVRPEATLKGIVREASTGKGVAGAFVRSESGGLQMPSTLTDSSGMFQLNGLAPGLVHIIAEHNRAGQGDATVDPEAGPVEVRLVPYGSIEGSVSDGAGAPADGRTLEVQGTTLTTTTDTNGWYRFGAVPQGSRRVVLHQALVGENRILRGLDVEVPPLGTVRADFTGGSLVTGRVVHQQAPVAEALVTFTRMRGQRPSGNLADIVATARTDGKGCYRLEELGPGHYTTAAVGIDFSIYRVVEVLPDQDNEINLISEGSNVEGIVLDALTGHPLPQSRVVAFNPSNSFGVLWNEWSLPGGTPIEASQVAGEVTVAYSGAEGRYRLTLPPGRFRLEASAPGFERKKYDIEVFEGRDQILDLAIEPSSELWGSVRDARGNPVPGAIVTASSGDRLLAVSAASDADGVFHIPDLPRKPCAVVAHLPDHGVGFVDGVEPSVAGTPPVEIEMSEPGRLRVSYRSDAAGRNLPHLMTPAGIRLEALLALAGLSAMHPTVEPKGKGEFVMSFSVVPAGHYLLVPQVSHQPFEIVVLEGQETSVDLEAR